MDEMIPHQAAEIPNGIAYAITKREWSELRDISSALNAFTNKFKEELDGAGEGVFETIELIQRPLDRLLTVVSHRFWKEDEARKEGQESTAARSSDSSAQP